MPRVFSHENKNGSPAAALWLTTGLIQVFLLVTLVSQDTYLGLIKLAASCVLVPYLLCALFGVKTQWQARCKSSGDADAAVKKGHRQGMMVAVLASFYAVWLLYAAGLGLVLKSTLLYALGIGFYAWARIEQQKKFGSGWEWFLAMLLVVGAVVGGYEWYLSPAL